MQTTQSTHWMWPYATPPVPDAPTQDPENASAETEIDPDLMEPAATTVDERKLGVPPRERDARREIDRLRGEIEELVRTEGEQERETARAVVDAALESVTRLQIVTANIDACG